MAKAQADRGEGRQSQVRGRSGNGNQDHIAARMPQGSEVDRNRLRVAKQEWGSHEEQKTRQNDSPDRIDVLQRVEGQSPASVGGIVAESVGRIRVCRLMKRD